MAKNSNLKGALTVLGIGGAAWVGWAAYMRSRALAPAATTAGLGDCGCNGPKVVGLGHAGERSDNLIFAGIPRR
jgi:hypothetical protein